MYMSPPGCATRLGVTLDIYNDKEDFSLQNPVSFIAGRRFFGRRKHSAIPRDTRMNGRASVSGLFRSTRRCVVMFSFSIIASPDDHP